MQARDWPEYDTNQLQFASGPVTLNSVYCSTVSRPRTPVLSRQNYITRDKIIFDWFVPIPPTPTRLAFASVLASHPHIIRTNIRTVTPFVKPARAADMSLYALPCFSQPRFLRWYR